MVKASLCVCRNLLIFFLVQDDSQLNRKIVRRILESSQDVFPHLNILEADDGTTAIEEVKKQMEADVKFDYILIDFVMVR